MWFGSPAGASFADFVKDPLKAFEAEMEVKKIKSADYLSREYRQSEIITRRSWIKD